MSPMSSGHLWSIEKYSRYRPIISKSATGASGLTTTAQGGGRSLFLNLNGVAVQCLFCCYYLFPVILVVAPSKKQGSQTYKNHLVVRTPLYRHTIIIAHEFSPDKSQRRNCTAALHHLEVWPPSKGLCFPSESPQSTREEEGACV
jgi:hypothetical protein